MRDWQDIAGFPLLLLVTIYRLSYSNYLVSISTTAFIQSGPILKSTYSFSESIFLIGLDSLQLYSFLAETRLSGRVQLESLHGSVIAFSKSQMCGPFSVLTLSRHFSMKISREAGGCFALQESHLQPPIANLLNSQSANQILQKMKISVSRDWER